MVICLGEEKKFRFHHPMSDVTAGVCWRNGGFFIILYVTKKILGRRNHCDVMAYRDAITVHNTRGNVRSANTYQTPTQREANIAYLGHVDIRYLMRCPTVSR